MLNSAVLRGAGAAPKQCGAPGASGSVPGHPLHFLGSSTSLRLPSSLEMGLLLSANPCRFRGRCRHPCVCASASPGLLLVEERRMLQPPTYCYNHPTSPCSPANLPWLMELRMHPKKNPLISPIQDKMPELRIPPSSPKAFCPLSLWELGGRMGPSVSAHACIPPASSQSPLPVHNSCFMNGKHPPLYLAAAQPWRQEDLLTSRALNKPALCLRHEASLERPRKHQVARS